MAKESKNVPQEQVAEAVSKTDLFFKENRKTILIASGAIVLCVLLILGYTHFIRTPKVNECRAQMFPAEHAFQQGDYQTAFSGDGNILGFEEILSTYGSFADESAWLYAGICQLQLGEYESAISYLKKYKGKEPILAARAAACIGDCHVGLGDNKAALGWYEKAAGKADNLFAATYLLKAGVVCEELGDNAKALSFYKEIKDKYPQSIEGYDIDKYIARIDK